MWRLRYKLGFRDVAELMLQRGYAVTHETIRSWEFRFAPLLADELRARRRGRAGESWYVDETYVKVAGRWCYLYRAIDRDGQRFCQISDNDAKSGAIWGARTTSAESGGRRATT